MRRNGTQEYKFSIITINFNGFKDTCALIDSIPYSDDVEIVVVDNASRQDEASMLEQRYPHVMVVRSSQNLGFAGGNNLGIGAAHGQYLFFVNNDTEFSQGEWQQVERLIQRLEDNPEVAAVCPKIRFFWGDHPIQFAGYTPLSTVTMRNRSIGFGEADRGQYDTPHATPYVHGAAMMVRRDAIERAGLMPECYFLYFEELDWSMMLRRAGYDLWYDPACTILHKESQTTGQSSPLRTYYLARNRLLFARRNVPAPRRYLTYLYLMTVVCLRDVGKNVLQRRFSLAKAALSGMTAFFRGEQGYHEFAIER